MSLSQPSIAVPFVLACCLVLSTVGFAQAAPKPKIRVLLVTGGHSYAREPFLDVHHALVSFQRWPQYEHIIGGRWLDVPEKGGDPRETPSGYEHDVTQKIRVLSHPVTKGIRDFEIHDEIYWGYRVGKDVTPLLTTSHPRSGNPIAWARTEQQSRVVYLQLGHGPSAFAHPSYRRLVGNAIRFAARR